MAEEDQDFRVAGVIEGSHYRYTVASLLSFALLMIYRKQINDLNSLKQITEDIARTCELREPDRVDGFLLRLSTPLPLSVPYLRVSFSGTRRRVIFSRG